MVDLAKMRAKLTEASDARQQHKAGHGKRLMDELEQARQRAALDRWAISSLIEALHFHGAHEQDCGWEDGPCHCHIGKTIKKIKKRLRDEFSRKDAGKEG